MNFNSEEKSPCRGCDYELSSKKTLACLDCSKIIGYQIERKEEKDEAITNFSIKKNVEENVMTYNVDLLQKASIKELLGYFEGGQAVRESKKALQGAKLAVCSLSAVGRIKATERAGEGNQLMLLKTISNNNEEFKKYVADTMPQLMPKKLLPRPSK